MKIYFPTENVALLPSGVAVSLGTPGADPTQPIVKDHSVVSSLGYVPWGDANDFPQQVLKRGRRSTIIPQALNWKANLISRKVRPYLVDEDDTGKEILQPVKDPEILAFLDTRHFKRYVRESANDIFWFLNIFPELILSKDRKKITHIHPNDASYCRIGQQNSKGVSEHVYVNANWPNAMFNSDETEKIRALDPYQYDLVNWTRDEHSKVFKFIYPSSYPTPGNTFYQLAHWDGIRASGWLDVLEKVPEVKKAMFENQMTIKYHIQIPREYWPNEYGSLWEKATPAERDAIRMAKMEQINNRIVGAKNSGIALITEFGVSSIDGRTIEGWKIEAIPDKLKDGAHLADNMEATSHLLYSLGLDPTLVGFASKEMGSRSGGSDKRESLLIYLSQLDPYRDVLYEPLDFIAEFNGWKAKYPGLEFRSKQTILTTLDTGAGSTEKAA
jgi:hypothetical protein